MTVNRQSLLTTSNIEICFEILSADKKEITLKNLKSHLNYESDDLTEEFANLTNEVNRVIFRFILDFACSISEINEIASLRKNDI